MNRDWTNEQGAQTSKTPTCLLLKPDLSFDSFGYEAIEKYSSLQDESQEKEYLFFKHFKMALHSNEIGDWTSRQTISVARLRKQQKAVVTLTALPLHMMGALLDRVTQWRVCSCMLVILSKSEIETLQDTFNLVLSIAPHP